MLGIEGKLTTREALAASPIRGLEFSFFEQQNSEVAVEHSRLLLAARSYKELEKALGEQAKFEQEAAQELKQEEELINAKKKDWLLVLYAQRHSKGSVLSKYFDMGIGPCVRW